MIGFSFTQNNIEYVIVLLSVTYTSQNKLAVGSQELEIYDSTVMASLEAAIAAYQPGGSSGDYSQGYADGEAAMESAIASSQAVTANLYKSKLASEDATIAAATAKSLQLCPTLCDPIDSSPPGSPIPGILQARTLEWVAISFSNA